MATDISSSLSQMGSSIGSALGTTGFYIMWIFIVLAFFAVVGFFVYRHYNKKSYKIDVVIMRPIAGSNSFNYERGLKGKQYFDKQKKELRFGIYQAKKKGLQYNNEAIPQKFFVRSFFNGGSVPMLFMTPNAEGWLQPTMMTMDGLEGIKAKVNNADFSYYQTELELMEALFGNKSFFEKYYLLILVVLMIIVVLIQWYAASQVHEASLINLQAVQLLTDTATKIAAYANGNATQVIRLG